MKQLDRADFLGRSTFKWLVWMVGAIAAIGLLLFVLWRLKLPQQLVIGGEQACHTHFNLRLGGGVWIAGEDLIVNTADSGRHYLKVDIAYKIANSRKELGLSPSGSDRRKETEPFDPEAQHLFKPAMERYQDTAIKVLVSKRHQDIVGDMNRHRLEWEIQEAINQVIPERRVLEVVFSDYVYQ